MKNNIEEQFSSLKFFNFEGMTSEKIIQKYELVLSSREKQITDLSMEIGSINDRITFLSDKCKKLEEENEMFKNRSLKRENILSQELNNKEIMFMRLERKEQECDEMKKKLEKYESNKKDNLMRVLPNKKAENFINSEKIPNIEKEIIPTNTKQSTNNLTNPTTKSSALDKIRELKERKNNPSISSRISLTTSTLENQAHELVAQSNETMELEKYHFINKSKNENKNLEEKSPEEKIIE